MSRRKQQPRIRPERARMWVGVRETRGGSRRPAVSAAGEACCWPGPHAWPRSSLDVLGVSRPTRPHPALQANRPPGPASVRQWKSHSVVQENGPRPPPTRFRSSASLSAQSSRISLPRGAESESAWRFRWRTREATRFWSIPSMPSCATKPTTPIDSLSPDVSRASKQDCCPQAGNGTGGSASMSEQPRRG